MLWREVCDYHADRRKCSMVGTIVSSEPISLWSLLGVILLVCGRK